MKLSIANRLRLLGIIPEKGDLVTVRVLADLRKNLALTEDEIAKNDVRLTGKQIVWNENTEPVDIEMGDVARKIISSGLKSLDESNELTIADIELWDMFVEEK